MFMKIDLKMFAMKILTVCVKVGKCILACYYSLILQQLNCVMDSVVYTAVMFMGSQIHVGQHWFSSHIDPEH